MLVVTRKVGERVVVPDVRLLLTVLSVSGGRVRLGISAPPEVNVVREELVSGGQKAPTPEGKSKKG